MLNQERRNEKAHRRLNQCRSRWEISDVRMNTCSRKTRNQRAVHREKLNRNFSKHYEVVISTINLV